MSATVLETKVETRRYVYPPQSNASGTAHGGDLVKWMEQTGAMSAMRFAGADTLTVSMDDVQFRGPIPQGSIALVDAYVYDSGTSSVTTRVRGYDENRHTAERDLATRADVTHVAVDDDGETVAVPDVVAETDEGERLLAAARGETD